MARLKLPWGLSLVDDNYFLFLFQNAEPLAQYTQGSRYNKPLNEKHTAPPLARLIT